MADSVVEQDFVLGAGHLVVEPDSLEATLDLGESVTTWT